jgi:hypothetical protein
MRFEDYITGTPGSPARGKPWHTGHTHHGSLT